VIGWWAAVAAVATLIAGCASNDGPEAERSASTAPTTVARPTSSAPPSTAVPTSSAQPTTVAPTTTIPATTMPATTMPVTTMPVTTMTAVVAAYTVPVTPADRAGWNQTHAGYPATDIFLGGCGATIVAPTNGAVLEVRRTDSWDPTVDNPATRGGRSLSMLGDDGVRYYLAHFETIAEGIEPGTRLLAGAPIGTVGTSGRSSACHVHFAISPPCPGPEWSVRRGVVWPFPYLDDWRAGGQESPAAEVAAFVAAHPNACAEAMADPNAADS